MSREYGLGKWAMIASAGSLTVAGAAMAFALVAAGSAHADGRALSARLVPADATAAGLSAQFTMAGAALREYVATRRPDALASYQQAVTGIPAQERRIAAQTRGYPPLADQLATATAALRAWQAHVAGPELAAAARDDFPQAMRLQDDYEASRRYSLPARRGITDLQSQLASTETLITRRLASQQSRLLAALLIIGAVVVLKTATVLLAVRRWLLGPLTALRGATERIAAGDQDVRVPAVGPQELAHLGHATELMRTRLVDALARTERAERRFRTLFESAPDATLIAAQDGAVVMANTRAERLFGYGPGALPGRRLEDLVSAADRDTHLRRRGGYFSHPESVPIGATLTLTMISRERRPIPAEVSLSSLPTDEGIVLCASIRDTSERLEAQAEQERLRHEAERERERFERRTQQSERLESLGRLVGGVAHDFNNLLNVITGYTDLVAEQVAVALDQHDQMTTVLADIAEVRSAADRAARLTSQLLAFARRDVIHPVALNLGDVVTGLEQLLRRTLGDHVELIITLSPAVWAVTVDPGQIEQVLVNLAVNGRDAMPGGGKLAIDTDNIVVDDSYPASQAPLPAGRYVRLRVSDTGTGMDRDVLERAFEPFFTTKPHGRGTGLGLATIHGIVTRAGGYTQIYSEPGFGTNVSVLLPATVLAAAEPEPEPAAPEPGRGELILLIENEQSLWQLTRRILVGHGYRVCAASTPAEALRQASDLQQTLDLLITDVVMPEMLGNELAGRVRAICPELPVLFMSGYAQQVLDSQGALEPGVDLLEKPFAQATLLARVRQAIDGGVPPGRRGSS